MPPEEWISGITAAGRPRVVIVGAGFGGLWAAQALRNAPVEVLLLDRNNYHVFLPLLYQVGAAELEPEEIAAPVRSIVRSMHSVHFALCEVQAVDLNRRIVHCGEFQVAYDYLIVAPGSVTRFLGVPGAERFGHPLKSLTEGVALRSHILRRFEEAVNLVDRDARRRKLAFVIVGGGATGVEYAGALSELVRGPLASDFPRLDLRDVSIRLVEAGSGLLPGMSPKLSRYAWRQLQKKGITVCLNKRVTRVTAESVELEEDEVIPTETVVWASGVRGDDCIANWGLPVSKLGWVTVEPTLQVPGHSRVYVVGDLALFEQEGRRLPLTAPVATQQGRHAARNILRSVAGTAPLTFRYRDLGSMVTIGRNAAVAHVAGRDFTGFPAWLLWLTVHIFRLIGFRNRLQVLINWAWDYIFHERAVRLIMPWGLK
ncbi:MAG: NAD(P)/FAD-dependent oxidoreductase [Candidatus Eisenbacteria sp.]|nr:NAD(P)/FAD-dependent oxidoreductase [Candidatus Eisenbacteria bacterium]